METQHDEFLSEEDLDLRDLSEAELIAYWNLWLEQAQASNDLDEKHTVTAFSKRLLICATPRRSGIRHNLLQGQLLAELNLFVLFHFR